MGAETQTRLMSTALIVALAAHAVAATKGFALRGPSLDDWKQKQSDEAAAETAVVDKQKKMSAVDKVVELLTGLQTKVLAEGEDEAATYNKFSCWCKDTTKEKSESIKTASETKTGLVADIGTLSDKRDLLDGNIKTITGEISDLEDDMREATASREKEMKIYETNAADLTAALSALEGAIKMMKASKKPELLQKEVSKTVDTAVLLADALNIGSSETRKTAAALLQQEPDVPMENYKFHSDELIKTLEKLEDEFRKEKVAVDQQEVNQTSKHDMFIQTSTLDVEGKTDTLNDKKKRRAKTVEEVEATNQRLSTTAATLLDDQQYLTQTAQLCQEKANTWDQRSKMRAEELTTLTAVIGVIKTRVTENTTARTVRLAQQGVSVQLAKAVASDDTAMEAVEASVEAAEAADAAAPVSFLQKAAQPAKGAKEAVAELLRRKGGTLKSAALTYLASQIAADPLAKVKTLIQELIEHLLQEAANEANQKGWCDKALTDAKQKRDYAAREIRELNGQIAELEAIISKLTFEMEELKAETAKLDGELKQQILLRAEEKKENGATIDEARDGEAAIDLAIDTINKFYKTAKKATVDLSFSQRGPANDAPDAGFDNGEAYTGAQSESGGILGMMEVMKSDFARTISETQAAEKEAEKEFLLYSTEAKKSLAEKDQAFNARKTQKEQSVAKHTEAYESLSSESEILTSKIAELQKLKPACIDTGMSYKERVARRKEEIDALQNALCILKAYEQYGPDGASDAC